MLSRTPSQHRCGSLEQIGAGVLLRVALFIGNHYSRRGVKANLSTSSHVSTSSPSTFRLEPFDPVAPCGLRWVLGDSTAQSKHDFDKLLWLLTILIFQRTGCSDILLVCSRNLPPEGISSLFYSKVNSYLNMTLSSRFHKKREHLEHKHPGTKHNMTHAS